MTAAGTQEQPLTSGVSVLVTGGTGNVGTAVVDALVGDPNVVSVAALARRPPGEPRPGVQTVVANVAVDDLGPAMRGVDVVVHLAWLIQPSHDRAATRTVNVDGSRRVFQAAARAGVRALVHASSVGAYAPGPADGAAVNESWPTTGVPTSFYSRDKADAERELDRFETEHPDVRVVRLRPGLIFQRRAGAEMRKLFTGPLFPRFLASPRFLPVVPDTPGLRFQVVHARDVADAYRRAVLQDVRGPFNVAADPVLDPRELGRLLNGRPIKMPAGVLRAAVDISWRLRLQPTPAGWIDLALQSPLLRTDRARTELGWSPTVSAGDALLELLEGIRSGADAPTPPLSGATGRPPGDVTA